MTTQRTTPIGNVGPDTQDSSTSDGLSTTVLIVIGIGIGGVIIVLLIVVIICIYQMKNKKPGLEQVQSNMKDGSMHMHNIIKDDNNNYNIDKINIANNIGANGNGNVNRNGNKHANANANANVPTIVYEFNYNIENVHIKDFAFNNPVGNNNINNVIPNNINGVNLNSVNNSNIDDSFDKLELSTPKHLVVQKSITGPPSSSSHAYSFTTPTASKTTPGFLQIDESKILDT